MEIKEVWKKFWDLLWKDDSWKGWLFSIIFIFIFIKLIFFPVLSLATGTALPLAIVESCSMYHENNLFSNTQKWWVDHTAKYSRLSINLDEWNTFSLKRGFNKGDILFALRANPEKLEVGDVIIFEAGHTNPLIHRIVRVKEENGEKIFSTIGDNNPGQLEVEQEITEDQLIGKAVFRLTPYAGWLKLIFFEFKRTSSERGFCKAN